MGADTVFPTAAETPPAQAFKTKVLILSKADGYYDYFI